LTRDLRSSHLSSGIHFWVGNSLVFSKYKRFSLILVHFSARVPKRPFAVGRHGCTPQVIAGVLPSASNHSKVVFKTLLSQFRTFYFMQIEIVVL
jgi:hypothetical protein